MRRLFILWLVFFSAISLKAGADSQKDSSSARSLVHLLDYLAQDYGGAVSGGKVISASEYAEQKEFAEKASELHSRLPDSSSRAATESQMIQLGNLISSKGDADSVGHLARKIKQEILATSGIATAPMEWPSLAHGGELFKQNCVLCHGPEGKGDGPAGAGLQPHPANLQDMQRMSQLSPFQVFNTVRLGVDGTGMPAFKQSPDRDVWDLAFYVLSLRYRSDSSRVVAHADSTPVDLQQISILSDKELKGLSQDASEGHIASLRLRSGDQSQTLFQFLEIAKAGLDKALAAYRSGQNDVARDAALAAYLEGIEPLEPRLRSRDPEFVSELEQGMQKVRGSIQSRKSVAEVSTDVDNAKTLLLKAKDVLNGNALPPWAVFSVTVGILLREGFEAVLILLAILGVVNAAKSPKAAYYVHGGWITAVILGVMAWFLSGELTRLSGAGRELTEGFGSLLAVVVLLYMGFWMHSKSEVKKWKAFVDGKIQALMNERNLLALGIFSFIVVFREAFETVLFLSALNIEGSGGGKPILAGVLFSFALIFIVAWIFLKSSRKLPLRTFFSVSSFIMVVLAVILAGKGVKALQEAGILNVTQAPMGFGFEIIGVFPTYETWIGQLATLLIAVFILNYKKTKEPRLKS